MIAWSKISDFVRRRAFFVTAAVVEEGRLRLFPIGSLLLEASGSARYFEILARPLDEDSELAILAVDLNPFFWLWSLIRGAFPHPPALRLLGRVGQRRAASELERQSWFRKVGWLIKTRGGAALWSNPRFVRELQFLEVEPVHLGKMTRHLENWTLVA
jgi:hypothetical protein